MNPFLPEVGRELSITGTIFSMEAGKMSAPIKGEAVVAVAEVTKFNEPQGQADVSAVRNQKLATLKQRSEFEVQNALKEKANIEDNRGKFY
jgi:peptidylprolyl isomerase/peptidyl-prolyl cis-trans isomerase D